MMVVFFINVKEKALARFSLFDNQVHLAHLMWSQLLQAEDHVVDATCGNGKDACFIASLIKSGKLASLTCLDIQPLALKITEDKLFKLLGEKDLEKVDFQATCHSYYKVSQAPKLVIYNLGYLPGGDKSHTTQVASTLKSLDYSLSILQEGGMLSVMSYLGHKEGEKEYHSLLVYAQKLCKKSYSCVEFKKLNAQKAPALFLIYKRERVESV